MADNRQSSQEKQQERILGHSEDCSLNRQLVSMFFSLCIDHHFVGMNFRLNRTSHTWSCCSNCLISIIPISHLFSRLANSFLCFCFLLQTSSSLPEICWYLSFCINKHFKHYINNIHKFLDIQLFITFLGFNPNSGMYDWDLAK